MEHVISSLLGRYESGTLTRRELIQGLAMLTVAGGTASAADPFKSATSSDPQSFTCARLACRCA